jgi:hypothetical protein
VEVKLPERGAGAGDQSGERMEQAAEEENEPVAASDVTALVLEPGPKLGVVEGAKRSRGDNDLRRPQAGGGQDDLVAIDDDAFLGPAADPAAAQPSPDGACGAPTGDGGRDERDPDDDRGDDHRGVAESMAREPEVGRDQRDHRVNAPVGQGLEELGRREVENQEDRPRHGERGAQAKDADPQGDAGRRGDAILTDEVGHQQRARQRGRGECDHDLALRRATSLALARIAFSSSGSRSPTIPANAAWRASLEAPSRVSLSERDRYWASLSRGT